MAEFLTFGTHDYRIEDDLLFLRYRGLLTPDDAGRIMELVRQVRAQWGRVLVLTDSSHGADLPPETRKAFMDALTPETRMDYQAVYGMARTTRVMAMLLMRAARLLGRSQIEIEFFATEAEARAYLGAMRRVLQSRQAVSSAPSGR